jgi:hypothetical protein
MGFTPCVQLYIGTTAASALSGATAKIWVLGMFRGKTPIL